MLNKRASASVKAMNLFHPKGVAERARRGRWWLRRHHARRAHTRVGVPSRLSDGVCYRPRHALDLLSMFRALLLSASDHFALERLQVREYALDLQDTTTRSRLRSHGLSSWDPQASITRSCAFTCAAYLVDLHLASRNHTGRYLRLSYTCTIVLYPNLSPVYSI